MMIGCETVSTIETIMVAVAMTVGDIHGHHLVGLGGEGVCVVVAAHWREGREAKEILRKTKRSSHTENGQICIIYTTRRSHRVSSCTCPHRRSQYDIPHFLHRYAPLYPHTEQNIRGGTGDGGADAVRYDGCVGGNDPTPWCAVSAALDAAGITHTLVNQRGESFSIQDRRAHVHRRFFLFGRVDGGERPLVRNHRLSCSEL